MKSFLTEIERVEGRNSEDLQSNLHSCVHLVVGILSVDGRDIQAVPVRGIPKLRTSMGTVRLAPRLSMLKSGIQSSGCLSLNEGCCLEVMVSLGDCNFDKVCSREMRVK
jgi:hypothetical protein